MRWVPLLLLALLAGSLVMSLGATPVWAADAMPDRPALEADLLGADRDRAARAAFALAELDERSFAYAAALAHYRSVLRIDPGHWFATTARARAENLARYEGQFELLAVLDRVRKDPRRADDRAEIERLSTALATMPVGRVRTEGLLFVAQAWVGRFADPARAATPALTAAREADDPALSTAGFDIAWTALQRTGDLARARAEIGIDPRAPEALRKAVAVAVRRALLHRVAIAVSAIALLAAVFALARVVRDRRGPVALRRILAPRALLFLAFAPLGSAFVAERWEPGMAPPFLLFGIGLVLAHLLSSLWASAFGRSPWPQRLVGAFVGAGFVVAAAYLALERSEVYGTSFLSGFGL
ncbi:MAG: hypothetical protein JNL79_10320 [Myxococcales bacterium]|nr:hypothetical protein [Myxococcales bacterium]